MKLRVFAAGVLMLALAACAGGVRTSPVNDVTATQLGGHRQAQSLSCSTVTDSTGVTYTVARLGGGDHIDVEYTAYAPPCDVGIYISPAHGPAKLDHTQVNGPFRIGAYFDGAGSGTVDHTSICVNGTNPDGTCISGPARSSGTGLNARNTADFSLDHTNIEGYQAGFATQPCPNDANRIHSDHATISDSVFPWSYQGGENHADHDSPPPPSGGSCAGSGVAAGPTPTPTPTATPTSTPTPTPTATPTPTPTPTLQPPPPQSLYVTNAGGPSITVYAGGASGNAAPTRTISGPSTGLTGGPWGEAVDATGNIYTANPNSASVTIFAAGANGNAAPAATISGSNTGLGYPTGVAVDAAGKVYVANPQAGTTSITVYSPGTNGNQAPIATISGSNTGMDFPYNVALDKLGNIYVANNSACTCAGSITIYAAGASGNATPVRTIAGPNTGLGGPFGIAVDTAGDIFVANDANNSITMYAAGANGNATPALTISGTNTGLNFPRGVAIDATGQLYVADEGSNSITTYAAGANGNATPTTTISGASTGLNAPFGVALH